MSEQKTQPVKKFRVGTISASIWQNEELQPDGTTLVKHSVQIQKRYRDQDGNWHDSNSYFPNDLPKLQLAVEKAYEFLALEETGVTAEQTASVE